MCYTINSDDMKKRIKNPIFNRLKWILIILTIIITILGLSYYVLYTSYNNLTYDLGEKSSLNGYGDLIITNYSSYLTIMEAYNLNTTLNEKDFLSNYYVASFQEYDNCSESKYKKVEDISYSDTIKITFRIYNKCGWCAKHIVLHLIKIDKVDTSRIEYDYIYNKSLNCGEIS